jgi:hypothetical protein
MLLARGAAEDRKTARSLIEDATLGYEALEMPRHAAMARAVVG